MFLRKSFQEFLVLHSEADPPLCPPMPPSSPVKESEKAEPAAPAPGWLIDWRWLAAREDVP